MSFGLGTIVAQVKLEDVFKSAQENMTDTPSSGRLIGLILGGVAIILVLVVVQQLRKRSGVPKPVNHQGRLVKEVVAGLPIKKAELRHLRKLAEAEGCSSPLVLLLTPSVLIRALNDADPAMRRALEALAGRIGRQ